MCPDNFEASSQKVVYMLSSLQLPGMMQGKKQAGCGWHLRDEALLQDRVNDGVNVFIQVLKQERKAILNGQLQMLQEVAIIEGFDFAFKLFAFSLLDPVYCLAAYISTRVMPRTNKPERHAKVC